MNMRDPGRIGSQRGSGLVELVFSTMLASIVLTGLVGMLIQQHRFYLVTDDAARVSGVLHRMETAVIPEFFPLSPGASDISFVSPDSVQMRVFRGVYAVCDKKLNVDVFLTVRALTGAAAIPPDSALVYSVGTRAGTSDDHWKVVNINSVKADVCPDGTRAWTAMVPDLNGVLSQVPMGAPVRAFRHGSYWLTSDNGQWTLRSDAMGISKIIGGSLAPDTSAAGSVFQFNYLDIDGNPTSVLTDIARIETTTDPLARRRTVSIGLRNFGL